MSSNIITLTVKLYEEDIGKLTLLPGERILFSFDPSYAENPTRPTLSLSFFDQLKELITDIPSSRTHLPAFFSNLLPEGPLRELLAEQLGININREFFLLWALGSDLPGAVTISPSPEQTDYQDFKVLKSENISSPQSMRFSLAGVQLKFSAMMNTQNTLTLPSHGIGGSWIVKLPSLRFKHVPENEFSMMSLAKTLGIDIPEVQLIPIGKIGNLPKDIPDLKGQALAIRRFDRTKNQAIHIEDFAQVFGVYPQNKYQKASYKNIAEVLWQSVGKKGIEEFARRLVFNTLIGNADMHLKNWSLIYRDKKQPELSPAYDFVSTIAYLDDPNMALNYVKFKDMRKFSLENLEYLAHKAGVPKASVIRPAKETINHFLDIWPQEQKNLPLHDFMLKKINNHLKSLDILRTH